MLSNGGVPLRSYLTLELVFRFCFTPLKILYIHLGFYSFTWLLFKKKKDKKRKKKAKRVLVPALEAAGLWSLVCSAYTDSNPALNQLWPAVGVKLGSFVRDHREWQEGQGGGGDECSRTVGCYCLAHTLQ